MENKDTIYLLYTCDEWKSRDSMRVSDVTTDKDTLYSIIASNVFEGTMSYQGIKNHAGLLCLKADFDMEQIDFGKLSHGFVEERENENAKDCPIVTDYSMGYSWLTMGADDLQDIMNFGNSDLIDVPNESEEDMEQ